MTLSDPGAPGRNPPLPGELTAEPSPGGTPVATPGQSLQPGQTLDHFEVLELLGAGGFGQVYKARDTRLERMVAIKVLPDVFAKDAERRERLRREAIAASALNHPNICTVHDLVEAGGHFLIIMELVEGKTLHAALKDGPLPVVQALPIAIQIADALAEAHRTGILHRDIKSGNIAITPRGQVKILDFGLAKLLGAPRDETASPTLDRLTAEGTTLGTLSYMAPEQLLAQHVDRRSDLFSFGVVLYEMLTHSLPFEGSSPIAVAEAILHAEPRDFGDRPVPAELKAVVRKLLQKDPQRRLASAEEVRTELKAVEDALAPKAAPRISRSLRIAIATAIVVAAAAGGLLWHRASRARWALETAAPEAERLIEGEEFIKAATVLRQARAILPKDATLEKLWLRATGEVTIESTPPGAEVSIRPYRGAETSWERLGQTPLRKVRLPYELYVCRVEKPGFATTTFIDGPKMEWTLRLNAAASVPTGMVPVVGLQVGLGSPFHGMPKVKPDDFLIDRHEVTNEEFKRFVDAGGYEKREYWTQPFTKAEKPVPWEEAVALFVDATGRPGPATWEVGSFPKGLEKHPVSGVSWYEAAAYAEFVGKSLPTAYHWTLASEGFFFPSLIAAGANFQGATTQAVGAPGTLSGFGTTDMAGNVKEWCWNEASGGTRVLLGGSYGEPSYRLIMPDAQSPWDRRPTFGFRCVKLASPGAPAAMARLEQQSRDYSKEVPVSDEVLGTFRNLYTYDKTDLNARIEATETAEGWTHEKVTFDAAYGAERVIAHLFLPRNASPPFQTVVYFPGAAAMSMERFLPSAIVDWGVDFVPRSGRALVFPIYKSTFERRDELRADMAGKYPAKARDHVVMFSKDLGRTLDYLETRKDIDSTKVAYIGFSWGGQLGPLLVAVEERLRAAILVSGGLKGWRRLPEADPFNFAPRVKVPVLMLNDRYDNLNPVETAQLPLFRLLGTQDKDKRHVVYDSDHGALPHREVVRESLAWLDKYLGPVKR